MKIALVDDDRTYINEMAKICREFCKTNATAAEISSYTDGESFLGSLGRTGYDIVFMDVYMDGTDGISAAKSLRGRGDDCMLVFTTSSMEHMPDAFSCHAFEYIVKPFERERVLTVLSDAQKRLPQTAHPIDIYSERKTVQVVPENVLSVVTDAHYIDITLTDGTMLRSRMTMVQFMEQTDGDSRFISINKGITVNADYVAHFENNCCVLENGMRFPIRIRDRIKIERSVMEYNVSKIRSVQKHSKE